MLKTAGVILFLGWNSWKDIRKKEISLIITGIFAFLGIMTAFYNRNVTAQYFIPPLVGGAFVGISAVSGNQIGAGDGLLLIALGTVLGFLPFVMGRLPLRFVRGTISARQLGNILANGSSEFFSSIAGSVMMVILNSVLISRVKSSLSPFHTAWNRVLRSVPCALS